MLSPLYPNYGLVWVLHYIYNPYDIPMVKIRLSGHIPIYPH